MNPPATAFDAWTGLLSAALYLLVAIAALAAAPRDARARVFFAIAVCGTVPYTIPALMWLRGNAEASRPAVFFAAGISIAAGSVALFHFTQVFPSRRPWIRAHGVWLPLVYGGVIAAAAIATRAFLPVARVIDGMASQVASTDPAVGGLVVDGAAQINGAQVFMLLAVLLPTVLVAGIVLPFAGLLSLYKSWQDARRESRDGSSGVTLTILISQLAGGVLTILIVPLLHVAAPTGPWAAIAAALLFGVGLLFPIAFAAGVWRFRVLERT
jgi:hypothetical protein